MAHPNVWADLFSSLVALLIGFAWPAAILLLLFLIAWRWGTIAPAVNDFLATRNVKIAASPTSGIAIEIAQQVEKGLAQQVASGPSPEAQQDASNLHTVATTAASQLAPGAIGHARTFTKVLWLDDHPENNLGLQYAFQALGMIVVCLDSNNAIQNAFRTAGGFDVVITDMYRDPTRGEPEKREAGLEAASIIRTNFPTVPVIIYAGGWSAEHANDRLQSPVIAITNNTHRVFDLVTSIARKKVN
jgi:CheY-like chemotaxis protein